jgi:threonine/homoserine/homoserine lactone efflux protein
MTLLLFLIEVFIISFSGAAQPGPVTATAIATGSRNRYAGLALAIGHGIIEFPVMVLIMLGLDVILKSTITQIIIGAAGGIILLLMAAQMLASLRTTDTLQQKAIDKNPVWAGIILSAGNPYFLLWWATIGLALATTARSFGIWAFALFAIVHWLVDCVWLHALAWASFKGSRLLGPRLQSTLLKICAVALIFFGLFFIYSAVHNFINLF